MADGTTGASPGRGHPQRAGMTPAGAEPAGGELEGGERAADPGSGPLPREARPARATRPAPPDFHEMVASKDAGALRILRRILVFLVVVGAVYFVVLQTSHVLFAPKPRVTAVVSAPERVGPGEPVSMAAVVRNRGWMAGAAFVVAVLGNGVEVEGPTVVVPARDTAVVPVSVSLGSGDHTLSLVVFDSWRGIRRLQMYRGIEVHVGSQDVVATDLTFPQRAARGEVVTASLTWANPGAVEQKVVPVLVLRPTEGGAPVPFEGTPTTVPPGASLTLEVTVDTWRLGPGAYVVEAVVRSQEGETLGRGEQALPVEISEG